MYSCAEEDKMEMSKGESGLRHILGSDWWATRRIMSGSSEPCLLYLSTSVPRYFAQAVLAGPNSWKDHMCSNFTYI